MSLFENFLSDSKIYDQAVDFWNEMCSNIFIKNMQEKKWKKWFEMKTLNGERIRDGNPITSWINGEDGKGIRIIQVDKSAIPILAHMEIFDKDVSPVNSLVVRCHLSNETAQISTKLIDYWVGGSYEYGEMQNKINEVIARETESTQKK